MLSRERLLELANARDSEAFDRAVDLRIMRIRRKIEPDPTRPAVIRTIRGGGYLFSPAGDKTFLSLEGARHITFTGGLGILGADDIEMSAATYTPIQTTDAYGRPMIYEQRNPARDKGEREYLRERNLFSAVKAASLAFCARAGAGKPRASSSTKSCSPPVRVNFTCSSVRSTF